MNALCSVEEEPLSSYYLITEDYRDEYRKEQLRTLIKLLNAHRRLLNIDINKNQ